MNRELEPQPSSSPDRLSLVNSAIAQATKLPREAVASSTRRGARHPSLVDSEVLHLLNEGDGQTVNLMEMIAVDQAALMQKLFRADTSDVERIRHPQLLQRMRVGAAFVLRSFGDGLWVTAQAWRSDIARGWAAMAVGQIPRITLEHRLRLAYPFAVDDHFGVREWAWISIRDRIAGDLTDAMCQLRGFAEHESPRARRFASESTRPIGVWCRHIPELRKDPSIALPLLNHLKHDDAPYVRLSVANWLNDASKDSPQWVRRVCADWRLEEAAPDVYRRAMRTLMRESRSPAPQQRI